MNTKRLLLEAAALIGAAVLCALVANGIAARERKMTLVGYYPNAQKVPAQATETTAVTATVVTPPPATTTTTTTAPQTTTIVLPTTTTVAPKPPVPVPVPAPVPVSSPPAQAPKSQDLSRFAVHADKPYVEIKYDDVAALHAAGALFLDARRTSVYEQGHIAGARPYSVWEADIDDKVRAFWEQHQDPKEQAKPIVVYCSGGDCEDSHMLAEKLFGAMFNNVYVYKDGFPDWQKHGGAVHTGPNP